MLKSSAHEAYTLIEILIVIGIIGLLMSIGILQYRDYSRRQSLTSAARNLVSGLTLAQENALSGKKPALCTSLNGYRVKTATPTANSYTTCAVCNVTPIVELNCVASPAISDITYSSNQVMFKVLGQGTDIVGVSVNTVMTITVSQTSTGKSQTVSVAKGGVITWP
jgi:prepilin-type N-terminal cleavage/methylation domain-containing protein